VSSFLGVEKANAKEQAAVPLAESGAEKKKI
jgi:hypothetical protein